MPKAILVCVLLLSCLTPGIANENGAAPPLAQKDNMSSKAAFDQACLDAILFAAKSYNDREPLSVRASANVKMCNGHPSGMICEVASQAMLREYEKTPFTCGTNTADSVPLIFLEDAVPSSRK
jgi:hypothetical protein